MGVTFVGEPEIDRKLPPDEQRLQGLKKEFGYYQSNPKIGLKYNSVRATSRYESDVKLGLAVELFM
jgi:hypothetical protein